MKKYILPFLLIFLISCSKNYEQDYKNYKDFSKQNQRGKGWFPSLISNDAFNLKSSSSLDPFHDFGVFEYTNAIYYDSIFKDEVKISISEFEKTIKTNIGSKPSWFMNIADIKKKDLKVVLFENFILVKRNQEKKIYFVMTDGMNFNRLRKTPQNQ